MCALAVVPLEDTKSKAQVMRLVSGSLDSKVFTWDLSTRQTIGKVVTLADNAVWNTCEWVREPMGGVLLLVMSGEYVRFYSLAEGKRVKSKLQRANDENFNVVRVIQSDVSATALDSSSKRELMYTIATGSIKGVVRLWSIKVDSSGVKCESVQKLGGLESDGESATQLFKLVALADGRLASINTHNTVRLWNLVTNACTQTLDCEKTVLESRALPVNNCRANADIIAVLDLCALSSKSSRANADIIAVLARVNENQFWYYQVQCWDVADTGEKITDINLPRKQINEKGFTASLVCVGLKDSLFTAVLETECSGSINLWPISVPPRERPNAESFLSQFADLKRTLLAIETQARGTPVQLQVLNLTAVSLFDDVVGELLHYLRTLPSLKRVEISSAQFELSTSEAENTRSKKLTSRAMARLFMGLQYNYKYLRQISGTKANAEVVSLTVDGSPVSWRQACEWVFGCDVELHSELVEASHVLLVEQFTNALYNPSIEAQQLEEQFSSAFDLTDETQTLPNEDAEAEQLGESVSTLEAQQLMHMFESVLCVSDLRWPYTLLNAYLLSGLTTKDRDSLVGAMKKAFEWIAKHAMTDATSVADLKSVLRSALSSRVLNQREYDILDATAVISTVFSDARYASLVAKVVKLRADLGALDLRLTRELAKQNKRITRVEQIVENVELDMQAVAHDLQRLREAFNSSKRREAAFGSIKVLFVIDSRRMRIYSDCFDRLVC